MRAPANILNLLLLSLLAGLDPSKVGAGRASPADGKFAPAAEQGEAVPARTRRAMRRCRAAGWLRGDAGARPWLSDRPGRESSWRKRLSPLPGISGFAVRGGGAGMQAVGAEGGAVMGAGRLQRGHGTGTQSPHISRSLLPAPPQHKLYRRHREGAAAGARPRLPAGSRPAGPTAMGPIPGKEGFIALGDCTSAGEAAGHCWEQAPTDSLPLEIHLFGAEPEALSREDTDFRTNSHALGCGGVPIFSNVCGLPKDRI